MVLLALSAVCFLVTDRGGSPARVPGSARGTFFLWGDIMLDIVRFWLDWLVGFWSVSVFQYFWYIALFVFVWAFIRRLIHIH